MEKRTAAQGSILFLFTIVFIFLTVALLSSASPAMAEGDVTLSLAGVEEYSSNFYREEDDKTAVWSTIVRPGIAARAWTDRSAFQARYNANVTFYNDNDERVDSSKDDYVGHELDAQVDFTVFQRLKFKVTDFLRHTNEPEASEPLTGRVDRGKYTINQVSPSLTYDFAEKFQAILGYRHEDQWYKARENSHEDRGYFTLRYNLNEQNSIEVEQQYWDRQYERTIGYRAYQTKGIFRRKMTDYMDLELGGGYQKREFKRDSPAVEDWDGFVFRGVLSAQTDITKFFLSFDRNLNDFASGNEYYLAHRATLSAERRFFESLTLRASGYYQKSDYERTRGRTSDGTIEFREDDIYNGRAGVQYSIMDWMSIGVDYSYTERDSNIVGSSFKDHTVAGIISFAFSTRKRQEQ